MRRSTPRSAPRSRCARTSRRFARRGCWKVSEVVTERLSSLGAQLRDEGVRVGLDELLAAHRALAAVDAASRAEAYFALRAVLCSRHEDLAAFAQAFEAVFGRAP